MPSKSSSEPKKSPEPSLRPTTTRYPGIFTDWSGRYLATELRKYITVGNIVRIPIVPHHLQGLDLSYNVTMYFRIIKRCKKDKNCFVGVCEDPYNGDSSYFPFKNGDKLVFSTRQICEIPLEWDGNQKLRKYAKFRNVARAITGAVF